MPWLENVRNVRYRPLPLSYVASVATLPSALVTGSILKYIPVLGRDGSATEGACSIETSQLGSPFQSNELKELRSKQGCRLAARIIIQV